MPLLFAIMAEAGLGFGAIDRIAVTTGPGSFTGIRVALAAAHGLALALHKPIIGITVFEAMAAEATAGGPPSGRVLIAVESRRAECFVQLFDRTGRKLGEPGMLNPEQVPDWTGTDDLALAGDAAHRLAPYLPSTTPILPITQVDTVLLARLAAERFPGPAPAPFYLRAADAKPARSAAVPT